MSAMAWSGTRDERLDLIRTAADVITDIGRSSPGVPVPRYPGWTMTDLLVHTGRVHRRTTDIVANRLTERPELPPEPDSDVADWFAAGVDEMVEVLGSTDPDTPCWGFGDTPDAGFWLRRMSLETTVHRWDAQSAVGVPDAFEPDVAADGIDEIRIMWLGGVEVSSPDETGPIVTFDPSDAEGVWTVLADSDRYRMVPEDMEAPCRISGAASDIYLAILGRLHGPLREDGEIGALARWRSIVKSMGDARR